MSSTLVNAAIAAVGIVFLLLPIPPVGLIIGVALLALAAYRQFS